MTNTVSGLNASPSIRGSSVAPLEQLTPGSVSY
jgi:hypothetical protein